MVLYKASLVVEVDSQAFGSNLEYTHLFFSSIYSLYICIKGRPTYQFRFCHVLSVIIRKK